MSQRTLQACTKKFSNKIKCLCRSRIRTLKGKKRLSITEEKSFLQKQASFAILYHMKKGTNKMVLEVQTTKVIHQNILRFSIQILNRTKQLKVGKSWEQIMVSSFLFYGWKKFNLRYHSTVWLIVSFFCSFLGRIEDIISCFRDFMTFRKSKLW